MATKMLVCPECAASVAPGRFACSSCGALLASVATGPRSLGSIEPLTPPIVIPPSPVLEPAVADDIEPQTIQATGARTMIGPAWVHGPLERAPGETDLDLTDDDAPLAAYADPAAEVSPAAHAEELPGAEPAADVEPIADASPFADASPSADAEPAADAGPTADIQPALRAGPEADPTPGLQGSIVAPGEVPAEALVDTTGPGQGDEPSWPETRGWPPPGAERPSPHPEAIPRPHAGAYLPPSEILTTVEEPLQAGTSGVPSGPAMIADPPVAPSDDPATAAVQAESRWLPGLDPVVPPRVVAIGAVLAGLGFLLPWAAVVIGSGRIGGYFEQWGLAGPGHPVLVLVIIALGAVASQVDRLPDWVRPGLPAITLAGLLVGLVWPYLLGSLQPSVGVYVTLVGALVFAVGGFLDLWAHRHAGASLAV